MQLLHAVLETLQMHQNNAAAPVQPSSSHSSAAKRYVASFMCCQTAQCKFEDGEDSQAYLHMHEGQGLFQAA